MSEANEVVDVAVGTVHMLDIDRDFIWKGFHERNVAYAADGETYSWADFVREALLSHAAEVAL